MNIKLQELAEMHVRPHVWSVCDVFDVVVQLNSPLIQVDITGDLKYCLAWQFRQIWVLFSNVCVELAEYVVPPF